MVGGAWPFLVGGAICLVNSDNERDSGLLNSSLVASVVGERGIRFGGRPHGHRRALSMELLRGTNGFESCEIEQ